MKEVMNMKRLAAAMLVAAVCLVAFPQDSEAHYRRHGYYRPNYGYGYYHRSPYYGGYYGYHHRPYLRGHFSYGPYYYGYGRGYNGYGYGYSGYDPYGYYGCY